jgi:hypothetical protein
MTFKNKLIIVSPVLDNVYSKISKRIDYKVTTKTIWEFRKEFNFENFIEMLKKECFK